MLLVTRLFTNNTYIEFETSVYSAAILHQPKFSGILFSFFTPLKKSALSTKNLLMTGINARKLPFIDELVTP